MRAFIFILTLVAATLSGGVPASAQEGHPMKGSWIGEWGPAKTHGDRLLLVLNWDGKAITGRVNPGTDNMTLKSATLDPNGWVVKMEIEGKDAKGGMTSYQLEGKIDNLAFHNRTLSGTWKGQGESGKFNLVRQ